MQPTLETGQLCSVAFLLVSRQDRTAPVMVSSHAVGFRPPGRAHQLHHPPAERAQRSEPGAHELQGAIAGHHLHRVIDRRFSEPSSIRSLELLMPEGAEEWLEMFGVFLGGGAGQLTPHMWHDLHRKMRNTLEPPQDTVGAYICFGVFLDRPWAQASTRRDPG